MTAVPVTQVLSTMMLYLVSERGSGRGRERGKAQVMMMVYFRSPEYSDELLYSELMCLPMAN